MKNIKWMDREELDSTINNYILKTNKILDIGCGIRPQRHFKPLIHMCVDPHEEYLDYQIKQKKYSNYNKIFINADWKKILSIIPNKSIDTVFIQDVIEHVPKKEAKILLKKTEEIVTEQIIIFTPLGFIDQKHKEEDAWGLHGGKWQNHKSGWEPQDFDKSWKIFGCKDFHKETNLGKKTKPFGAFYAIKTFSGSKNPLSHRIQLSTHKFLDKIFLNLYKMVN